MCYAQKKEELPIVPHLMDKCADPKYKEIRNEEKEV